MDVPTPAHGSAVDTAGTVAALPEACSAASPFLSASGARASGTTRQPPVIPQGKPGLAPGLSLPDFGAAGALGQVFGVCRRMDGKLRKAPVSRRAASLAGCRPREVPRFGLVAGAGPR